MIMEIENSNVRISTVYWSESILFKTFSAFQCLSLWFPQFFLFWFSLNCCAFHLSPLLFRCHLLASLVLCVLSKSQRSGGTHMGHFQHSQKAIWSWITKEISWASYTSSIPEPITHSYPNPTSPYPRIHSYAPVVPTKSDTQIMQSKHLSSPRG